MTELEKIKQHIQKNEIKKAISSIKKMINSKTLSDPVNLEDIFSVLISTNPTLRLFLKYLKISKVPPTPINTRFDTGRRFFYALYIINRFGGKNFITPYIKEIQVNRPIELRYLAGIHYFNMDYKNGETKLYCR